MNRQGYTLFELLTVLTVISITLVVLTGSFSSWGTAHGLTGAARTAEGGLLQARTLSRSRNAYIGFEYGVFPTNGTSFTRYQLYAFTNDNAEVATALDQLHSGQPTTQARFDEARDALGASPAAPPQRLPRQILLSHQPDTLTPDAALDKKNYGLLVFRPDGSVWSAGDTRCHYLCLYTQPLFNKQPLVRILRVDLTTGLATPVRQEVEP